MPQHHQQALRDHRPMSRRVKFSLLGVTALVIAAAVVAVLLTTSNTTQKGCIHTYLPGVIGAQTYDECGQEARQTCATIKGDQRQFGTVGVLIIENACRKGQIVVG